MPDEQNGRINRVKLVALEKDFDELKVELKETCALLQSTREDLTGARTEIRIFGSFIMAALMAVITLVLQHIV